MEPLSRNDVIKVIEGKGTAERIPLLYDIWIYDNLFQNSPEMRKKWLKQYPCDVADIFLQMPGLTSGPPDAPDFYWAAPGSEEAEGKGLDARCLIEDWEDAEAFYASFPDPESPALIAGGKEDDGRYLLGRWWYCFFERLWSLRGMENALTDFYLYPEEIHRLFSKLTVFYMRVMERAKEEMDVDGFFVSDDIGTQTAPFFSLEIFQEFFKPYYKQLIDKAHELGVHFWLHSCGNIELFLPAFIEIGLDVIHPIQRNTMNEQVISEKFGNQICILAGVDVQYLMAFGTPEEVRDEIRFLKNTYRKPEGRFMLTMGNGSTPDWKMENLEALYEASYDGGGK
ncbi:uroporphyrinogen decarboxylase family protein [Faecalicatena orotica]|uniref:uroporphyrinogen decarboxylase family protein n=1 Tax=Faecalicatena orotica TaxID=1544 RepID=UPI003216B71C